MIKEVASDPSAAFMRMLIICASALLPMLALPVNGGTDGSGAGQGRSCERVPISNGPGFIYAGLWVGEPHRQHLLMVEPQSRLAMFEEGRRHGNLPARIASNLEYRKPVNASSLGDGGFLVETNTDEFWQFTADFLPAGEAVDITPAAGLSGLHPYQWMVLGQGLDNGGLLVCGQIRYADTEDWKKGLFHIPLGAAAEGETVTELLLFTEPKDINRQWCRISGQIFAEVDGDPYVLLLSGVGVGDTDATEQPQIYRIDRAADDIDDRLVHLEINDVLPKEMRDTPPLTINQIIREFPTLMSQMQSWAMPMEMVSAPVGARESLLVLLRSPNFDDPSASTNYKIARIDPETRTIGITAIHSRAQHARLVAGSDQLAFIELGRSVVGGPHPVVEQPVVGVKLVPMSLLTNLSADSVICY